MKSIYGDSRVELEKIILSHLKTMDKDIDCDDSDISSWRSDFESKIVFAWIIRIIEDTVGKQIFDQNKVNENLSVVVEIVFQEIAKTLQYVVNDFEDLEGYAFDAAD